MYLKELINRVIDQKIEGQLVIKQQFLNKFEYLYIISYSRQVIKDTKIQDQFSSWEYPN